MLALQIQTCGSVLHTRVPVAFCLCASIKAEANEQHSSILLHKCKWNFCGMTFIVRVPRVHQSQHYKGNTTGSNKDLPLIVKHDLGVSLSVFIK